MTTPRIAPLEGDRISPAGPLLPDFLTDASKTFFITPRWRVRVYCGDVLVKVHEWTSAADAAAAVEAVRAYGYTDAVRYETELVEEVPR